MPKSKILLNIACGNAHKNILKESLLEDIAAVFKSISLLAPFCWQFV